MKPLQCIIDGTRLGNMVFPIPLGINFNLMYVTTLYNLRPLTKISLSTFQKLLGRRKSKETQRSC